VFYLLTNKIFNSK